MTRAHARTCGKSDGAELVSFLASENTFPQPYNISFEDLTEDQAKTVWDSYLAHVPLGVRADFSTS